MDIRKKQGVARHPFKRNDEEAEAIRLKEMQEAEKKVQHTNTGQRGVKAYTTAIMGTAQEQANAEHQKPSPVKHIPIEQHLAECSTQK